MTELVEGLVIPASGERPYTEEFPTSPARFRASLEEEIGGPVKSLPVYRFRFDKKAISLYVLENGDSETLEPNTIAETLCDEDKYVFGNAVLFGTANDLGEASRVPVDAVTVLSRFRVSKDGFIFDTSEKEELKELEND